jgi:hypothetical protein
MVEFTLAGTASFFLLLGTFNGASAMWNYHTLANAVHETTRHVAVRGYNCTLPGNTCSLTIATIAQELASEAIGVSSSSVNVTFTTDSGAVTSCAPLSSCFTDSTVWPPATNNDNQVGRYIQVAAIYRCPSPLLFFWPGAATQNFGDLWFPAASTQKIIF